MAELGIANRRIVMCVFKENEGLVLFETND